MLKIVNAPNPVLTTPVQPVKQVDAAIKKLIADMDETLVAQVDPQGVGLAATQVGKSLALFIIKPKPSSPTEVFINPTIIKTEEVPPPKQVTVEEEKSDQQNDNTQLEGCLSVPKIWSPIRRPGKVEVSYTDANGKRHTRTFKGFKAVIIQHEVDHLNGILFTQRALEQSSALYEERMNKDKEVELKKIEAL